MKYLRVYQLIRLAFLSATTLSLICARSALSAQLLFSPDGGQHTGSLETAIPINHLGSVPLPRGRIVIKGDTAQVVMTPEWQFDPRPVLVGRVLDTRVTNNKGVNSLTGTLFFTNGEWLNYYDDPTAIETLQTSNGTIVGRITGVTDFDFEVTELTGKTIGAPLSTVQQISSPRAFEFTIPMPGTSDAAFNQPLVTQTNNIALNQLGRTFKLAQLRGIVRKQMDDGDVSTRKLVAIGTALSLIEVAQTALIVGTPLAFQHSLQRRASEKEKLFNIQSGLYPPY